jgi:hypothetical protein
MSCTLLLEVYDDDKATVLWEVSTDPGHVAPYLVMPDRYQEQEVDVATGSATIAQVAVTVIDPAQTPGSQQTGWLTAKLGIAGFPDLIGRRCRLLLMNGVGTTVVADGPASSPRLDPSYAAYSWDIRDIRDTERKIRAFEEGGTSALLPHGVLPGYGYDPVEDVYLIDPVEPVLGVFSYANSEISGPSTGFVQLESFPGNTEALRTIPIADWEAMAGEVVFGASVDLGDTIEHHYRVTFRDLTVRWRDQGSADAWTEIRDTLIIDGVLIETVSPTPGYGSIHDHLVDSSPSIGTENAREVHAIAFGSTDLDLLPDGAQDIELVVISRKPPSKEHPLHLEGLTVGELIKGVVDGEYGPRDEDGNVIPTGIRYDEAAVLQITDEVRMRLMEPIPDVRDWLEKYAYTPTGWAPALDTDGRLSPVWQVLTQDPETSPELFATITDAITEPSPDWDGGTRIINVLRFKYPRDYVPEDPAQAQSGDGLRALDVILEFEDTISVDRNGRQVLEIDGRAFRAIGTPDGGSLLEQGVEAEVAYGLAQLRQAHVQARYSLGAPTINVPVRRSALPNLRAGDWAVVSLSWCPDYFTGQRGLQSRIAQVIAVGDLDCAWRRVMLELASASQVDLIEIPIGGGEVTEPIVSNVGSAELQAPSCPSTERINRVSWTQIGGEVEGVNDTYAYRVQVSRDGGAFTDASGLLDTTDDEFDHETGDVDADIGGFGSVSYTYRVRVVLRSDETVIQTSTAAASQFYFGHGACP